MTLQGVTVHSSPGMGILEADGEGKAKYLKCRVVPGPRPPGASEDRLLSTSWDAMQAKTVHVGPRVEACEIADAGDDSWSVQSSDFLIVKREGKTAILASRDEFTTGVEVGDRLLPKLGAPEVKITGRKKLSRKDAGLSEEVLEKLEKAPGWSEWKVSPSCIEVQLDREPDWTVGDSVFSPDRMGNGFVFTNNRVHSAGRILIKASGRVENNLLDTPHALTVCPELPGNSAAGIDGLMIRNNVIRRAGWFCPAPWSSQAGALSITASTKPPELRPAGVFAKLVIEDNTFEDCEGPNLVISSVAGASVSGNRFIRPLGDQPPETGASFGIPRDAVIWISESEDIKLENNPVTDAGKFMKDSLKLGRNVNRLTSDKK